MRRMYRNSGGGQNLRPRPAYSRSQLDPAYCELGPVPGADSLNALSFGKLPRVPPIATERLARAHGADFGIECAPMIEDRRVRQGESTHGTHNGAASARYVRARGLSRRGTLLAISSDHFRRHHVAGGKVHSRRPVPWRKRRLLRQARVLAD